MSSNIDKINVSPHTFTMPSHDVDVTAVFTKDGGGSSSDDRDLGNSDGSDNNEPNKPDTPSGSEGGDNKEPTKPGDNNPGNPDKPDDNPDSPSKPIRPTPTPSHPDEPEDSGTDDNQDEPKDDDASGDTSEDTEGDNTSDSVSEAPKDDYTSEDTSDGSDGNNKSEGTENLEDDEHSINVSGDSDKSKSDSSFDNTPDNNLTPTYPDGTPIPRITMTVPDISQIEHGTIAAHTMVFDEATQQWFFIDDEGVPKGAANFDPNNSNTWYIDDKISIDDAPDGLMTGDNTQTTEIDNSDLNSELTSDSKESVIRTDGTNPITGRKEIIPSMCSISVCAGVILILFSRKHK